MFNERALMNIFKLELGFALRCKNSHYGRVFKSIFEAAAPSVLNLLFEYSVSKFNKKKDKKQMIPAR